MEYKLRILSVKCYLPDESDGDEIYLKSNGKKIWPIDAKYVQISGESAEVNLEMIIQKGDKIPIEIWDYDNFSANDHLGDLIIQADAHGQFVNEFTKKGKDKSRYALEWELG